MVKRNNVYNLIVLVSFVLQVTIAAKFISHRIKIDLASSNPQDNFRREIIWDALICGVISLLFSIYGYIFFKVNTMEPQLINVSPNYLYVYSLHFGSPLIVCLTVCFLLYMKNGHMRETLWEEFKETFGLKKSRFNAGPQNIVLERFTSRTAALVHVTE